MTIFKILFLLTAMKILIIGPMKDYNKILFIATLCVIGIYTVFYSSQFILAAAALEIRFKALNELIDSTMYSAKMEATFNGAKIGKLFNNLCDGIEIVNDSFTFHFVLLFPLYLVSR